LDWTTILLKLKPEVKALSFTTTVVKSIIKQPAEEDFREKNRGVIVWISS